jgi:hypothetical protein
MSARKPTDFVQFKLRIREGLRRRLEREAQKKRQSTNQEAVDRLEDSFRAPIDEVVQPWTDMFTIMLGGNENSSLLRRLAAEMMQNPNWIDSAQDREEMVGRLKAVLDIQLNLVKIGRGEIES